MKKMIIGLTLVCLVILCPGPGGQEEPEKETGNGSDDATARKIKITMVRMADIGYLLERYSMEKSVYPDTASMKELYLLGELTYQLDIPTEDAWGNEFGYVRKQRKEGEGKSYYKLISPGPEGEDNEYIIYSNGFYVKYPKEFKYLFN